MDGRITELIDAINLDLNGIIDTDDTDDTDPDRARCAKAHLVTLEQLLIGEREETDG